MSTTWTDHTPRWDLPPTPPPPSPPTFPSPPPNRRGGGWRAVLGGFTAVALLGGGWLAHELVDDVSTRSTSTQLSATPVSLPSGPTPTIDGGDEPIADVAAAVAPAVVLIEVQSSQGAGVGSGVIYDASGLVMTNAHVVGDADEVSVRLADGSTLDGTVVGADTSTDIAVVELDTDRELPVARLAEDEPVVGQTAVALGSPFGLEQTVTAGIVSAVDRPVPNDRGIAVNMLQTDAPINPGNSGGALANKRGEVIGINTAIFSENRENNGIGFAIPISTAKAVADKIVAGDPIERAVLGIQGGRRALDQPGALVEGVTAGSPADEAGVEPGDLIVAINGEPVRSFSALQAEIGTYSPGDAVTLEIERDGRTREVEVTLGG